MLSLHKLFIQDFTGRILSKRTQKRLGSYMVLLPVIQSKKKKKKSHRLYHSYPPSFNSLSTYQFKMIYSLLVCLPPCEHELHEAKDFIQVLSQLSYPHVIAFDKYLLNR